MITAAIIAAQKANGAIEYLNQYKMVFIANPLFIYC